MNKKFPQLSRRDFLLTTAVLSSTGLAGVGSRLAIGADFPEHKMRVFIPTRAGGGADRNFRAFSGVWKKYLGAECEPTFYPGAAGRVGYETYMGKASADGYDLIFGNMGPEVLNWVVKKPSFSLDDYFYFLRVDADPASIFVSTDSKLRTIDDIIAEGKKRTLTVATSRLAHPASLGALVLAGKTGMQVNLIPMSGGKNTRTAVVTGEVDLGVLPASTVIAKKGVAIVGLFEEKNVAPAAMPNAVLLNDAYDLGLPPLIAGARAFGIKSSVVDQYPDRYAHLTSSAKKVFDDPDYKAAVLKSKAPWEMITYGDADACKQYVDNIMALGREYRSLLTG